MNDIENIIEDVNKSEIVSKKVIEKIIEKIGQEEWHELHDKYNDIITTTGEVVIVLRNLELEKCELLGIIQQKDELIKKMKCCENCNGWDYISTGEKDCIETCCSNRSNWRLRDRS